MRGNSEREATFEIRKANGGSITMYRILTILVFMTPDKEIPS